jgi:hypothetical protein
MKQKVQIKIEKRSTSSILVQHGYREKLDMVVMRRSLMPQHSPKGILNIRGIFLNDHE